MHVFHLTESSVKEANAFPLLALLERETRGGEREFFCLSSSCSGRVFGERSDDRILPLFSPPPF